MLSINSPRRLMLASLFLVALVLSACNASNSGTSPLLAVKLPTQPLVRKFDLSARQGLRDLTGDFSVRQSGADTGMLLLPREKVEVFASGKADVQANGNLSAPDGTGAFRCVGPAMPEPTLPCYSVIYSIGLYGRAGEVGAHTEFNPTVAGNLFLGINAPHLASNSGSFHVTVLVIPPGTVAGIWVRPGDGFHVQGTSMTLSAYAFGQNVTNLAVHFTLMVGQTKILLCSASPGVGNLYSCNWDLTLNGAYPSGGKRVLGFTIDGRSQTGAALAAVSNPDGLHTGIITYAKTQFSSNYAGYAAIDFTGIKTFQSVSGSWTVPVANCSTGENSDAAIWIGMTPAPRNPASDNPFYSPDSPIFQIATVSGCSGGQPHYYIAWEHFPQPPVVPDFPLRPGYLVTTGVSFQPGASGQGNFTLSITVSKMISANSSQGLYTFQTPPLPGETAASAMAECIVEAPTLVDPNTGQMQLEQLTNFGHVDFTCNSNNDEPIADGPQDYLYKMSTDSFPPTLKATTSDLDATGATFTVTWNHA